MFFNFILNKKKKKKCCLLESKWKIKYDLLLNIYMLYNQIVTCICPFIQDVANISIVSYSILNHTFTVAGGAAGGSKQAAVARRQGSCHGRSCVQQMDRTQ